ncbi:MAG TPA: response regulator [Hyphomicrobiaceae bacterium]|nr:response regulator [Hyphomicrobiaceae bacterium]
MAERFRQKPLHGRRILVVEDVGLLAAGFEAILKDAGADVATAVQLKAAERLAEGENFSGALLDVRLNDDEVWSSHGFSTRRRCHLCSCLGILTGKVCRRNGGDGHFSSNLHEPRLSSTL